jgi:hypothetical protein
MEMTKFEMHQSGSRERLEMIGGERKQSTSPALYFLASVFLSRMDIFAY